MATGRYASWGTGLVLVTLLAGCGGGGPTTSNPPNRPLLAGGGRGNDTDNPNGGGENSGPQAPGFDPAPGLIPIFYADLNCFGGSFTEVLTDQTAFQTWWTTAISCQPHYGMANTPPPAVGPDGTTGNGGGSDGGVIVEPEPYDPYPAIAPTINWSEYAIAAIGLDAEATWGRGIWVTGVTTDAGGTTISYEVSRPGDDCDFRVDGAGSSAPSVAVLVPAPLVEPVTFVRTDTSWNCTWEPDPAEPWTIYFTDADCDLGPKEALITSDAAWQQWLDAAYDCDLSRWNDPIWGNGTTPGTGVDHGGPNAGGSEPGYPGNPDDPTTTEPDGKSPFEGQDIDPSPPPPGSWGVDVDFTTHAILLLRAGPQIRWGGGVWLNAINTTDAGTEFEYSVMQPGGQCPSAGGFTLRPTVAIRVPKPTGSVRFTRHTETLSCDWDEDKPLPAPAPLGAPRASDG